MRVKIINTAVAATLALASLTVSAEDMYRGAGYALPGISYILSKIYSHTCLQCLVLVLPKPR
jgi:hypothetical protein